MINLKLTIDDENKMIEVPTKWEDITVDQYQKIISIDTDDTVGNVVKQFLVRQEQFSILTGIDLKTVRLFSIEDFETVEKHFEFMKTEIDGDIEQSIIVDGEEFFLYTEFEKLNVGEQWSIDILTKEANGNLLNVYTKLLCMFLRKKKDNGKFESFEVEHLDRAPMFGKLSIVTVQRLMIFFLNGETI